MVAAEPTSAGTLPTNERRELGLLCCDKAITNWDVGTTTSMAIDRDKRLIIACYNETKKRKRTKIKHTRHQI
jgi:hypothetical protein